jgi:uncharacterized protein (TIGR03435 family)
MQLDPGRLDWGFASLADMIQYAFGVKNYQVSGPYGFPIGADPQSAAIMPRQRLG